MLVRLVWSPEVPGSRDLGCGSLGWGCGVDSSLFDANKDIGGELPLMAISVEGGGSKCIIYT